MYYCVFYFIYYYFIHTHYTSATTRSVNHFRNSTSIISIIIIIQCIFNQCLNRAYLASV